MNLVRMRQRCARNRELAWAQRWKEFEDMFTRHTHRAKLAQNLENRAADSGCIFVQLFLSMMSRLQSREKNSHYRAFGRGKFLQLFTLPLITGEMFENSEERSLRYCIDIQVTCEQGTQSRNLRKMIGKTLVFDGRLVMWHADGGI